MAKFSVDREMRRAEASERKGTLDEAKRIYETIVEKFPNNVRARNALSALASVPPQLPLSHDLQPRLTELLILYENGRFAEAAEHAAELVKAAPASFVLWNILGAANHRLGRLEAAEFGFRESAELNPASADAQHNLGNTLVGQGRLEEGIECFAKALQIKPDLAEARNNLSTALNDLGNALVDQGRLEDAIERFRTALQIQPAFAQAHNNLGNALKDEGRLSEAVASYERALRIEPDRAEVHNNLGTAFLGQGWVGDAIASYERALRINPRLASAHHNLGNALIDQGRLDEAVMCFRNALHIEPGHRLALSQKLHQQAHMCDWEACREFDAVKHSIGIEGDAVPPFIMLAREDHPERQHLRAQTYARQTFKRQAPMLSARPSRRPGKIRVGYFSGHFHDHATLYLASGLLREHDKSRFEIYAYSYGATHTGEMRASAAADVDHFIDVSGLSDQAVADRVGEHGIDIAIDLMGYTRQTRSRLFANRLAPIQINYLVYPGTMGADFFDYIVADPVVIPQADQRFYSEKVIYLPHSYQPNDNRREIARTTTTRADFGLPEDGFVLCCFNNNYKFGPREFDVWMRLLGKVDGSVLWLLRGNPWSEANLREEARKRGIDPARLVFAARLPHGEHLARHKHADLFVDTFNYNAHTTASDALWAGLPVVTKAGRQFAARVAASLLNAVGLPELITETEEGYEALILGIAANPDRLAALKAKLGENRLTQPLFDTARYTRAFEQALDNAFRKCKPAF